MKKNAFTIVELLAIIVILGISIIIIMPNIIGISDREKQSKYNKLVETIGLAAESYIANVYTNPSYPLSIELRTLIEEDYLKAPIKNPLTGGNLDYDSQILIQKDTDNRVYFVFPYQKENAPKLVTGMIPVYWDPYNSTWRKADTNNTNDQWYNYVQKKWANVVTVSNASYAGYSASAAGTIINATDINGFYVWIPRYIYKITSGWHTSTTGTIEIQFSDGTNDDWNNYNIGDLNTTGTANDSNFKWTSHPAFTFGSTETTGFWMAKFEASVDTTHLCYTTPNATNCNVTTLLPNFVPFVASFRYITVANSFDTVRNMETNNKYNWGTSGSNFDIHLVKNVEWGAVTYLAQSAYGKNAVVWANNSTTYITGCAGNCSNAAPFAGCQFEYESANGSQASTTGTVYGVFDMNAGSYERTSAYVDNGNGTLTTAGIGLSITSANIKYRDVYTMGATDTSANNYIEAINKKGDAVYETSLDGINTCLSWNAALGYMASATSPWIERGNYSGNTGESGLYSFTRSGGSPGSAASFRATIMVETGL